MAGERRRSLVRKKREEAEGCHPGTVVCTFHRRAFVNLEICTRRDANPSISYRLRTCDRFDPSLRYGLRRRVKDAYMRRNRRANLCTASFRESSFVITSPSIMHRAIDYSERRLGSRDRWRPVIGFEFTKDKSAMLVISSIR